MANLRQSILLIDLEAGGPGSGRKPGFGSVVKHPPFAGPTRIGRGDVPPRSQYDKKSYNDVKNYLTGRGFVTSASANTDPEKGPVVYIQHHEFNRDDTSPTGLNGTNTHTVIVYPNGEWEHSQESTHGGSGVGALSSLSIEKHKSMWSSAKMSTSKRSRRK